MLITSLPNSPQNLQNKRPTQNNVKAGSLNYSGIKSIQSFQNISFTSEEAVKSDYEQVCEDLAQKVKDGYFRNHYIWTPDDLLRFVRPNNYKFVEKVFFAKSKGYSGWSSFDRFDSDKGKNILICINDENACCVDTILDAEKERKYDENNKIEDRFSDYEIVELLKAINKNNAPFVEEFINLRDEYQDEFRFDGYRLAKILKVLNKDNKPLLDLLCNQKLKRDDDTEYYRFNDYNIENLFTSLAPKYTEKNRAILDKLLSAKYQNKEEYRFSDREMSELIEYLVRHDDDKTHERFNKLFDAKTLVDDEYRFSHSILTTLKVFEDSFYREARENNFDKIFDFKTVNEDGKEEFRFNSESLASVLKGLTDRNTEYLDKYLDARTIDNKNYRFNGRQIGRLLWGTRRETVKFIPQLFEARTDDQKAYKYDDYLPDALHGISDSSIGFLDTLINCKRLDNPEKERFYASDIGNILWAIKDDNKELVRPLLDVQYKSYYRGEKQVNQLPGRVIAEAINYTDKRNTKVLEFLINEINENGLNSKLIANETDNIRSILFNVKDWNLDNFKKLIHAKNPVKPEEEFSSEELLKLIKLYNNELPVYTLVTETELEPLSQKDIIELSRFYRKIKKGYDNDSEKRLRDLNWDLKLDLPLLPTSDESISALLNKISTSFDITESEKLQTNQISKVLKAVNKIDKALKGYNLEPYAKTGLPLDSNSKVILKNNPELAEAINTINEILPEFKETIGKKQHQTHFYTLDIHMLRVLQEFMALEDKEKGLSYNSLTKKDKLISTLAILFHDIAKKEFEVDKAHPENSSLVVAKMMRKLRLPEETVQRIIGLVHNHHWVEDLMQGKKDPKDIAFDFRRPGDYKIAKMFALADLKGIGNPGFSDPLMDNVTRYDKEIKEELFKFYSTGIFLPQTKVPKASKLQNVEELTIGEDDQKTTNKVIDFDNVQDFEKLGFQKGTTKDNILFLAHAVIPDDKETIEDFKFAKNEFNQCVFSSSYINPAGARLYTFRSYGFLLDIPPSNVLAASKSNLSSGCIKSLSNIKGALFPELHGENEYGYRIGYSKTFKEGLLENTPGINEENIDQYYARMYHDTSRTRSITDVKEPQKAESVINNIKNNLLNDQSNNEILVYAPQIQAIFTLQEPADLPFYIRKYAEDNDLPIIKFNFEKKD